LNTGKLLSRNGKSATLKLSELVGIEYRPWQRMAAEGPVSLSEEKLRFSRSRVKRAWASLKRREVKPRKVPRRARESIPNTAISAISAPRTSAVPLPCRA
jgi:hypothetical protein